MKFLRNLLMGESHELKNRYLHIAWNESDYSDEKQPIEKMYKFGFTERIIGAGKEKYRFIVNP